MQNEWLLVKVVTEYRKTLTFSPKAPIIEWLFRMGTFGEFSPVDYGNTQWDFFEL